MELHGMICLQMKDEAGPNAMSFMGKWWRTHLRFLPGGLKNTAGGGWSHQRCPWVCIRICILPWLVFMSQHRFVDSAFCSKRKYGTPHFQGVGTKIGRIWELDGIRWSFSRWWFAFTIHGFSVSTMFDPSFFVPSLLTPSPNLVIPNDSPKKIRKVSLFHRHLCHLSWPSNSASWDSEKFLARPLPAQEIEKLETTDIWLWPKQKWTSIHRHSPPFFLGKVIDPQKNNAMPRFRRAKSALREIVSCRKTKPSLQSLWQWYKIGELR